MLVAYLAWGLTHLGGSYWDTDEGINLMKARLVQLGHPLYEEVWADQPPGLTVLLAGSFAALAPTVEVARGVVLVVAVAGLAGIAWLTREASGGWPAAVAAVAFAATAPNFYWASRAVMIGLPALSLAALAMAALLAYCRTRRRSWLAAAGVLLGLSLSIKLIGAYLVAPFAVGIVAARLPDGAGVAAGHATAAARRAAADAAVLTGALLLVMVPIALAFDVSAMADQVVGTVAAARGAYALDVAWNLDKLRFWLLGDHLVLAALAAYGALALAARKLVASAVILTWLGLTLAALVFQSPLWPKHHFLALLMPMAPLAGIGVEDVARRLASAARGPVRRAEAAWLAAGVAALVVAAAGVPAAARADAVRSLATPFKESGKLPKNDAHAHVGEAVEMLRRRTRPGDVVLTDAHIVAFAAGRTVPPELSVISGKRIATGELTAASVAAATDSASAAAVLLWSGDRLQTLPGLSDWVRARYVLAETIDDDFELYLPRERGDDR
jgi:hypothetical protein